MYDDHLAVLFHNTRKGVWNIIELYSQFFNNNFHNCLIFDIYKNLSSIYDDIFVIICITIYHNLLIMALLCRYITQYSWQLFNLCHLYYLHLHRHSTQTLSLFHHCINILDIIRITLIYVKG